jgi:hypothetical protein
VLVILLPGGGALASPPPPQALSPQSAAAPESWIGQEIRLETPAPALSGDPPAPSEASESLWRGILELYGFAPLRTTGTTTIRGLSADVDLDLGQVLDALQFAASARGSVEFGRWGLLGDVFYVDVADETARLAGPRSRVRVGAEVGQGLGVYDLAVRYRFGAPESALAGPGTFSVIPYAGMRLIDGRLDLAASLQGPRGRTVLDTDRSLQRTWVQPLVGTQATVFLSPRLRAFARGDVGGFGLAGQQDLTGNAQVGLGYAIGDNTDLNLSWRYFGLEWNNGAERANGYTSFQNGIEVGVKFFFGGAPAARASQAPAPEPVPQPQPKPQTQP